MHSTFFRQTRRAMYISLRIVALFLMALCLRTVIAPTVHASGGGGGPMTSAVVNLAHSPTGTANLALDATAKTLTVQISLVGLAPNSTHPAHIHLESCTDPGPERIQYELKDVVAGANGQGTSTTVLQNISSIPADGWYINVHNGPGLTTAAENTRIACAAVKNPGGAATVNAVFGPTADLNENATGTAKLTITNNILSVSIDISGLAPNSSHAAHIHAGNCNATGGVLYDMTPLVADANGHATKFITFEGVSSIPATGWDINVHYSTDLSTQTGYNPILCGNVMPG